MHQTLHTSPDHWPVPLANGLLIELQFGQIETTHIELLDGGVRNLTAAFVRAASPELPEGIRESLLPDGTGSVGRALVISEPNIRYLQEPEYRACGFQVPSPLENELGDLGFITYESVIAIMEPSEQLPFMPLGSRVFFEFDLDDESSALHEVGESGLVMMESDLAVDNQLATVTAIGPNVEHIKVGDRVIVRRSAAAITLEGVRYHFVTNEHEIFALLTQ